MQKKIPIIIAANKVDLVGKNQALLTEAKKFAEENEFRYFETSARANKNVEAMFVCLAE